MCALDLPTSELNAERAAAVRGRALAAELDGERPGAGRAAVGAGVSALCTDSLDCAVSAA